jgi:DNA polymerase III subunit delta
VNYIEILEQLKKKIYHPIYVLMGEEPYFIDKISDYISDNVLSEADKSFNQTILYGKDTTVENIVMAARRFPMMSSHQVIVVKEAQNIKKLEEGLLGYVDKPLNSTILVICHKYESLDKRKKFLKVADSKGVVFESKKIYENQLVPWIQKYCTEEGYRVDPQAGAMLGEFLGTDISKVVNELDKLMILLPKGSTIKPEDVEKNIGISKDFNVFELQNALGARDILKANRIVNYFGSNPNLNPIPKTITNLYYYFSKLLRLQLLTDKSKGNVARELGVSPYFVDSYLSAARNYNPKKLVEIISLLREFDMKSKGVNNVSTPGDELQRELIFKILH